MKPIESYLKPDFRYRKITIKDQGNGKKTFVQYRPEEVKWEKLKSWIKKDMPLGLKTGYGGFGFVDIDEPDKKKRTQLLKACFRVCKSLVVSTWSNRYHVYYLFNEPVKVVSSKTKVNDSPVWEVFSNKGHFAPLPYYKTNGNQKLKKYELYYPHEIAKVKSSDIISALEKEEARFRPVEVEEPLFDELELENDEDEESKAPLESSKASEIMRSAPNKAKKSQKADDRITFEEVLSYLGMTRQRFVCPTCKNISGSLKKVKPSLSSNENSIVCHRCQEDNKPMTWTKWSLLTHWHGLDPTDKKAVAKLCAEIKGKKTKEKKGIRFSWLTGQQILDLNIPPRRFLLEGILPEAAIIILYGDAGLGKTIFLMQLCSNLSVGLGFMDWEHVGEPVRCAYVDLDMGIHDWTERLPDIDMSKVFIHTGYFQSKYGDTKMDLTKEDHREELKQDLIDMNIQLLILDNLTSVCPNIDENTKVGYDDMNQFLIDLRNAEITSVLVHHPNKQGGQSGTNARIRNPDRTIKISKPVDYEKNKFKFEVYFMIHFEKIRQKKANKHLFKTKTLSFKDGKWGEGDTGLVYLCKYTAEGLSVRDISERMKDMGYDNGYSKSIIPRKQKKLIESGWLNEDKSLTEKGENWVKSVESESESESIL